MRKIVLDTNVLVSGVIASGHSAAILNAVRQGAFQIITSAHLLEEFSDVISRRRIARKYPKATQCLAKDREKLLEFYNFPAEHWSHLRTTNPIESTFATVRLRTTRTKGSGTRKACLTMVFKLMQSASKR